MKKLLLLSALLIFSFGHSQSKELIKKNEKMMTFASEGKLIDAIELGVEMIDNPEFIKLKPVKRVMLLHNLGQWFKEVSEYDYAIVVYQDALNITDGHIYDVGPDAGNSIRAEILNNIGVVYSAKDQKSIAFSYYDEAVSEIRKNKKRYSDRIKGLVYTSRAICKHNLGKRGVCKDIKKADKYANAYPRARELFYKFGCF